MHAPRGTRPISAVDVNQGATVTTPRPSHISIRQEPHLMRTTTRLAFAGLAATIMMALAVSAASANHLSSSSQTIRAVWSPLRFQVGETTIASCRVTLEGSFHSTTIAKVEKTLIGAITRAEVGACESGEATVLTESLPWHVQYNGFEGTLPAITGVTLLLVGAAFRIGSLNFFCLARTEANNPAKGIVIVNTRTHAATGIRANERVTIPTTSGGGFGCPAPEGRFAGTSGAVTQLGTTTAVSVTLI